jgi:hypothetical protein
MRPACHTCNCVAAHGHKPHTAVQCGASSHPCVRHHAGTFEAVGSSTVHGPDGAATTASIAAVPGAVHFAGFTPGTVHTQTVRLVNTSAAGALRAHVVPPESPYFKVCRLAKAGASGTFCIGRRTPGFRHTVRHCIC